MKKLEKILCKWLVGLILACAGTVSWAGNDKPLLFGVLNQQSPVKTAQRWNPLLAQFVRGSFGSSADIFSLQLNHHF